MRITAGYSAHATPHSFTRAKGFPYWTIGALIRGRYEIDVPQAATVRVEGPSLICVRPSTPYRLATPGGAGWAEYFMIFSPRAEWLAWLNWPPTTVTGVMCLQLESPSKRRSILRAARDVQQSFASSQPESESFAYNAMERFLLLAHTINPIAGPQRTDARIAAALEHIGQHLASPLTVETISQAVGLSTSHLAHRFRQQIGQSPMRYIEATRMRRARDLLLRTDRKIADIARDVGFENAFHFSTRFRKSTGQSPRDYRRRPSATGQ